MKRLLVTGCGRTGTQFICRILQVCGFTATHEEVYNHDLNPVLSPSSFLTSGLLSPRGGIVSEPVGKVNPVDFDAGFINSRWGKLEDGRERQVEVSWMAAPFLAMVPDDVIVWHQLRNPLKSLRCWTTHHMLRSDDHTCTFVHKKFPECGEGSDLERAVKYHVLWNQLIESQHVHARYWVEDLSPTMLNNMLISTANAGVPMAKIEAAFAEVAKDTGTCRHNPADDVSWDQVVRCPMGADLWRMARRYGSHG